jgi:protein SCO1
MIRYLLISALLATLAACGDSEPLPILGNRHAGPNGDTIYPKVPAFRFMNQDSQWVTNATFADKAYVADFFFIHCPTICPKVTAQMKRVHDAFVNEPRLLLLAHSIDTKNDTVPALHRYAAKIGIENSQKWHFVTGEKDSIYTIAENYFSVAKENPEAPGGFDHSGRLILVDKNRHVRAFCDGTDPESVDQFIQSIQRLLREPQ